MRYTPGLTAAFLLLSVGPAWGANSCNSPTTSGGLAFGNYAGVSIASSNTGAVTCTAAVPFNLTAGAGTASGATVTTRKMTGPNGARLSYVLTRNAAHTLNWGVTPGANTIPATGTGVSQAFSFYGSVSAGQKLPPGAYRDTVAVAAVPQSGSSGAASLSVAATILAACAVSASSLNFGAYTGALIALTSSITVNCTNTTPYNVGLSAGAGTGSTETARRMTGPGGTLLNYSLYRDAARTLNWGNTVGVSTKSGTGTGSAQVVTVYGTLPAQPAPRPGAYVDTIIATVTY